MRGKSRLVTSAAITPLIQGVQIAAVWIDEADEIHSMEGGGVFIGYLGVAPCDTDRENDSPSGDTPEAGR
jgi:hypothetical protein